MAQCGVSLLIWKGLSKIAKILNAEGLPRLVRRSAARQNDMGPEYGPPRRRKPDVRCSPTLASTMSRWYDSQNLRSAGRRRSRTTPSGGRCRCVADERARYLFLRHFHSGSNETALRRERVHVKLARRYSFGFDDSVNSRPPPPRSPARPVWRVRAAAQLSGAAYPADGGQDFLHGRFLHEDCDVAVGSDRRVADRFCPAYIAISRRFHWVWFRLTKSNRHVRAQALCRRSGSVGPGLH